MVNMHLLKPSDFQTSATLTAGLHVSDLTSASGFVSAAQPW